MQMYVHTSNFQNYFFVIQILCEDALPQGTKGIICTRNIGNSERNLFKKTTAFRHLSSPINAVRLLVPRKLREDYGEDISQFQLQTSSTSRNR